MKAPKALTVKLLNEMCSEAAVQELLIALEDGENLNAALEALGRIGSDQAICKIPQAINGKPSSIQFLAIRILEQVGSKVAIGGLREIALNGDSNVKRRVDRALKKLGAKSRVSSLSQNATGYKLRASDSATAKEVLPISIQQNIHLSVRRLIQDLRPEDPDEWEKFVEMLERLDDQKHIPVLLAVLDEENTNVLATFALGLLGCERVVPQLLNALKDEEEFIRGLAVLALSKVGTSSAIEGVLQALQALDDPDVSEVAAELLIQLANESALPGLLQILENEWLDSDLRVRAAKALMTIGVEDAIEGLLQALQDRNFEVSCAVADILKAARKEERASRELLEKIKDGDYYVRSQSTISLGYLGDDRAIPLLIAAIDHEDPDIQWKIVHVLGRFSEQPMSSATLQAVCELATPKLIQLILGSGFNDARVEAIEALGKLGDPQLLSKFWQYSSSFLEFLKVIKAIQKRCGYYNYEIFQAYLEAQKNDRPTHQESDRSQTNYYIESNYGNLNTGTVNIAGDQIGVESSTPNDD
ncbi:HEAT repeat domain-containing protein [Phormidesmis sp. 146-12]